MTGDERQALFDKTAGAKGGGDATKEIKLRHICHCFKADPEHGKWAAKACGIDGDEIGLA